jgi:hypothetical protein
MMAISFCARLAPRPVAVFTISKTEYARRSVVTDWRTGILIKR